MLEDYDEEREMEIIKDTNDMFYILCLFVGLFIANILFDFLILWLITL